MNRILFFSGLIFCGLLVNGTSIFSQGNLKDLLQGKETLWEIMQVVDQYYADHPEDENEFESEYLQWKRWEWYMSSRLGIKGEFVNISEMLMKGIAEKEKMEQPSTNRNINSGWTFVGPSSSPLQNQDANFNGLGRVNKVVFHPSNSSIIYICTPNGGLWNTLNGGTTWNSLTDNIPTIGISGFVVSYANPNIMYVLTGDGDDAYGGFSFGLRSIGVLKSTDGGTSWHQTDTLPDTGNSYFGNALEQSPTDPQVLIAATSVGLYRTTDGGANWTKEVSGYFFDVKFKPGNGSYVYATKSGHQFYRSTDGGDTWASNSTFDVNPTTCTGFGGDRTMIAVSPTITYKVYLLSAPRITNGQYCGVWLSTDSGASFTRQSTTPNVFGSSDDGSDNTDYTGYCMGFACQSNLSTTIFAACCTVWKSTNGGVTWTHSTSYNEDGSFDYIHPDVHGLAYNPLNNWLYATTDGGVYRSQDHGVSWTDITHDVETSQFYHMAGWDGNINKLLGGLQDNGIKYRKDNTSAFYHIDCCDGFDVAFNPVNGEPAYSTINGGVNKYSSNGAHSSGVTPPGNTQFYKTLALHNTDTSIVLVGSGSGIFRSLNAGDTWTNEGVSGSWSLASCPSNNSRFYASGGANFGYGDGGVYFSSNIGDTWTLKSTNSGFPSNTLWDKITDVVANPINSNEVYASFGGFFDGTKVVKSTNTGDSWTNISLNLPNVPINCLAVDNSGGIYAGTDIGVFYKGASMPNWMQWSNGLPNVGVTELVIFDDGVTKRIRAATYGRGVWQSNMAQTCDAAVIVTGNLKGIRHYEASTTVTSSGSVQGGIGTFVSFQSGSYITLSDGFNVIDKSEFLGFISPCGQGGIPEFQGDVQINRADPNSSIILLRRMWDPETELPYGYIHQIDVRGEIASIQYEIKKPGKVEIIAARQIQDKLDVIYRNEDVSGKHDLQIDISNLPHEFHYLLLFYEGKLVHFQEMDLSNVSLQTSAVNH